jgi:hypothetical protein
VRSLRVKQELPISLNPERKKKSESQRRLKKNFRGERRASCMARGPPLAAERQIMAGLI